MTPGAPTVYFIDDSATMREVIKIAFRRENISVIACHDANSALAQMDQDRPDVVISDVIMPEKDGYQVCEYIKQHPRLGRTPVILMSGVVNRAVAERAFAVKADELIRKPFQPQDLIARVKHLLNPKAAPAAPPAATASASAALSSIFSAPLNGIPMRRPDAAAAPRVPVAVAEAPPVPTAAAMRAPAVPASRPLSRPAAPPPQMPADRGPAPAPAIQAPAAPTAASKTTIPLDLQKLKIEVLRLQGLVRKLQSELEAEREYSRALEAHIKTLQEAE
ncbi:MAG: two-component system response regulator [Terriglobales bacterium]